MALKGLTESQTRLELSGYSKSLPKEVSSIRKMSSLELSIDPEHRYEFSNNRERDSALAIFQRVPLVSLVIVNFLDRGWLIFSQCGNYIK